MNNMSFSYLAPLLLVICANTAYHFTSKSTPTALNPFLGLTVTYSIALVFSIVLFAFTKNENMMIEIGKIRWQSIIMGLAVLGVESGWILMYRNGWEVSKASLIANICVAIILFIIGIIVFREDISLKKLFGLFVCIIGVFFMNAN